MFSIEPFIEMDDNEPLTCLECIASPWNGEPAGETPIYFEHVGYRCSNMRSFTGNWCGYVDVPPEHPWASLDADAVPADVHGGLTWKEVLDDAPLVRFGFDCGHHGDWQPMMPMTRQFGVYRTLGFAKEWTMRLAEQFRNKANGVEPTAAF